MPVPSAQGTLWFRKGNPAILQSNTQPLWLYASEYWGRGCPRPILNPVSLPGTCSDFAPLIVLLLNVVIIRHPKPHIQGIKQAAVTEPGN